MKIITNFLLLLISLTFASCQEPAETKPQEPMWEREACARCRMILSEKRYAVQRILKSGEIHFYDDLNCALQHQHPEDQGKLYVRPYGGDNWIAAEQVKYISGERTPMNSGHGAVLVGGNLSFEEVKAKFKE